MSYKDKLSLYGPIWSVNELGEDEQTFGKIKDIFCNIVFSSGSTSSIGGTDVKDSSATLKIKCRKLSIKKPEISMYFVDQDGMKYEVLEFHRNYKKNNEWEFKVKITREV